MPVWGVYLNTSVNVLRALLWWRPWRNTTPLTFHKVSTSRRLRRRGSLLWPVGGASWGLIRHVYPELMLPLSRTCPQSLEPEFPSKMYHEPTSRTSLALFSRSLLSRWPKLTVRAPQAQGDTTGLWFAGRKTVYNQSLDKKAGCLQTWKQGPSWSRVKLRVGREGRKGSSLHTALPRSLRRFICHDSRAEHMLLFNSVLAWLYYNLII